MNCLSKIDTFLYDKCFSSTQPHKKTDRNITHQKIALICVFLAIFGLKNSRVWPESTLHVQKFFFELGYLIRLSKNFFLTIKEVKMTFPEKVAPPPTKRPV